MVKQFFQKYAKIFYETSIFIDIYVIKQDVKNVLSIWTPEPNMAQFDVVFCLIDLRMDHSDN